VSRGLLALVVEGFEIVGEGIVSHIVEEGGSQQGQDILLADGFEKRTVAKKRPQVKAHGVPDAQAMLEPGVGRAGIDEEGGPELLDPVQLLKRSRVDDPLERTGEVDVLPDGIPDGLGIVLLEMMEYPLFLVRCVFVHAPLPCCPISRSSGRPVAAQITVPGCRIPFFGITTIPLLTAYPSESKWSG
jgi:hypothetical protein